MGAIDLDPASTPDANEVVGAQRFYTADDDGSPNHGPAACANPPYRHPAASLFTARLAEQHHAGNVSEAIALTNNSTEADGSRRY